MPPIIGTTHTIIVSALRVIVYDGSASLAAVVAQELKELDLM